MNTLPKENNISMSQKRVFECVLSIDWLATNGTHSYNNIIIFILILFNQNWRSINLMFYLQGHFLKTFIEFPVEILGNDHACTVISSRFCYVYNILINPSLYAMLFNKIVAVPNIK